VYANDVKIVLFLFEQAVYEFGCAQDIVNEDVVEEFDVGSPFFEVVHNKEGKNVASIRNEGTVNLYTAQNFSRSQVARVQRENGDIVPDVYVLLGHMFCICSQAAYKRWGVFPNKKADPQNFVKLQAFITFLNIFIAS